MESKKVFIVISEWDSETGREHYINGAFLRKEDAIAKFNEVIDQELNSPYYMDGMDDWKEEYSETRWVISNNYEPNWFEVNIIEEELK